MSLSNFGFAPVVVNNYLWSVMKLMEPSLSSSSNYGSTIPFLPLGDAAAGTLGWGDKTYVIYDRMFKAMKDPSYWVKCEEVKYQLKAKEQDTFIWGSAIQQILDRHDDAAKDVNDWIRSNGGDNAYPIFFHSMRVFQLARYLATDSENIRDLSSRSFYVTEFAVDMKYHYTKSLEDYL